MALETIEAGNRVGRGPGLGIGASWAAASTPELTLPHLELQAEKIAARYGLTIERARVFAELIYTVRGRR